MARLAQLIWNSSASTSIYIEHLFHDTKQQYLTTVLVSPHQWADSVSLTPFNMIYRKMRPSNIFLSKKIKLNSFLVSCRTRPNLCAEIWRKFGAEDADDSTPSFNMSAPHVDMSLNTSHGGTETWTLPTSRLADGEEGGMSILIIISLVLLLLFFLYAGCCIGKNPKKKHSH